MHGTSSVNIEEISRLLDFSGEGRPVLWGMFQSTVAASQFYDVEEHNGIVYILSAWGCTLQIVSVSGASPVLLGSIVLGSPAAAFMSVKGSYAYIGTYWDGGGYAWLKIVDVSDPTNPVLAGQASYRSYVQTQIWSPPAINAAATRAYCTETGSGGLVVFDITDKTAPALLWAAGTYASASLRLKGNTAFVVDYDNQLLRAYDVSVDPPVQLGSVSVSQSPFPVHLALDPDRDYAYVGAYYSKTITTVDVSSPAAMTICGSFDLDRVMTNLRSVDETLYVSHSGGGGITAIDISDPCNPVKTWIISLPVSPASTESMWINHETLRAYVLSRYSTAAQDQMYVYDLSGYHPKPMMSASSRVLIALEMIIHGNLIMPTPTVPLTATSPGRKGQIAWDANNIYVCWADNKWKQASLVPIP